jgi:hypothetical protein
VQNACRAPALECHGILLPSLQTCTQVLLRDTDNAKALFRRGRARAALGQTEDAIVDLERACKLWVAWGSFWWLGAGDAAAVPATRAATTPPIQPDTAVEAAPAAECRACYLMAPILCSVASVSSGDLHL